MLHKIDKINFLQQKNQWDKLLNIFFSKNNMDLYNF